MKSVQMHMSVFNAERMRNVVGVGSSSAYRIRVSGGAHVGSLGVVDCLPGIPVANHGEFEAPVRAGFIERVRNQLFS